MVLLGEYCVLVGVGYKNVGQCVCAMRFKIFCWRYDRMGLRLSENFVVCVLKYEWMLLGFVGELENMLVVAEVLAG